MTFWMTALSIRGRASEPRHPRHLSILVADDVAPIPGELAISVASLAELQFGVFVAKNPRDRALRLKRLSAIQRRFDALPIGRRAAD